MVITKISLIESEIVEVYGQTYERTEITLYVSNKREEHYTRTVG